MIELLVVLTIVGILSVVGVTMIGNRGGASVRGVLDELEGTISAAHQFCSATGQDVMIATRGDWDPASSTPLQLSYGNAALASAAPTATAAAILTAGMTTPESFRLGKAGAGVQRQHMNVGIVTTAKKEDWGTGITGLAQALEDSAPFNVEGTGFKGILTDKDLNLFQGGTTPHPVLISGSNKRFTTTFVVRVVTTKNGAAVPGGAAGVLVGLSNGATLYKFYNPGLLAGGDGKWRKI